MEKYENLGIIGEGSYGIVMKCQTRDSGQLVAVKKFLLKMNDELVRKVATREIKMLKMLKHENLVNLIDVFRRKGHLYLIMEYVDHNLLDELQKYPSGLPSNNCRPFIWQILRGLEFCHLKNIIHRDIKPENVLVTQSGIIKLCDFGFARPVSSGETCTDYVSTRWYRAPELLVGDLHYGKEVDIWAVGCLFAEMITGNPMFPGDSDIDQLFCIKRVMGDLIPKHNELIANNSLFSSFKSVAPLVQPLSQKFSTWPKAALSFLQNCLCMDPLLRSSASALLQHNYFTWDEFPVIYLPVFYNILKKEFFPSSPCTQQVLTDLKCTSSSNNKKTSSHLPNLKKHSTDKSSTSTLINNSNECSFFSCVPLEKLQISSSKVTENFGIDVPETSKGTSQTLVHSSFMPPIISNRDVSSKGPRATNASKSPFNSQRGFADREKKSISSVPSEVGLPKANTELRLLGKRADRHHMDMFRDGNSARNGNGWPNFKPEVPKTSK